MPDAIHPYNLQARAALATHGLTGLLDAPRDGLMYFLGNWRARPPRADHGLWDCGDGSGRHSDALTLARRMAGPEAAAARRASEDEQLEGWMLRLLGEDGLTWLPSEPWAAPWGRELLLADLQDSPRYAEINWAQRGTLMGLLSRYLGTGEEQYLSCAKRLIDGLLRIAIRHPDGLLFPEGYYRPGGWGTTGTGLFPGIEEVNAAVVGPAVRLYTETGYQPALELADGLARFALQHTQGYRPDGRIWAPHGGAVQEHFHTRSCFIMGILKLGLALGRREYLAWARQSYAFAKEWGTDFGWFPEHLGQRHGEICCTTDMIEIALLLGKNVDRSYYADAERFGRNHLLESQLLSLEKLETALSRLPGDLAPAPYGGQYSTSESVARRQVGGFASRPTLNDAFHLDATDLMQCCNAAGTRALYDLWRYAIEVAPEQPGEPRRVQVHLRFSVASEAIKVVSYEPAVGRLDITARQPCLVEVRLPAGVSEALVVYPAAAGVLPMGVTEAVVVYPPAGARPIQALPAQDGYVRFPAAAGEVTALCYPLPARTSEYQVGKPGRSQRCTGYWRGETLMQVEPPGAIYPLYDRSAGLEPVEPNLPGAPLIESI